MEGGGCGRSLAAGPSAPASSLAHHGGWPAWIRPPPSCCVVSVDAAQALKEAINLFLEIGRLNMAARYGKDIGEIYQQEQDSENAAICLNRAADLFDSEGQSSQANSMTHKIAEIYAQLEKLRRSCTTYGSTWSLFNVIWP
ncbi:hypothetical protein BS78_10G032600 [Paspalum vaginatum]|nr:hypothetical protein BS78_10G032600 [Paspalum vaginatum]